jgi:hypothetical protein
MVRHKPVLEDLRFNSVKLLSESLEVGFIAITHCEMEPFIRDAFDIWSLFEVVCGESILKATPLASTVHPFPEQLYGKLLAFLVESTSTPEQFIGRVAVMLEYRGSSFEKRDWDVVVKKLSDWNCFIPGTLFDKRLEKFALFADEQFYASLLDSCEDYIDHMSLAIWSASKMNVQLWGRGGYISPTSHLSVFTIGIIHHRLMI